MARIESTCLHVSGIHGDDDVKKALQALYDIFAAHGMGQATFELLPDESARLWIKHLDTVQPDPELISRTLREAGDYAVVDDGASS